MKWQLPARMRSICGHSLVKMADYCMMYKYIVKNMAKDYGMVATFMPKPLFGDNGSGMHTHQSLWKDGKNIFFDAKGYGMISQTAKYYIGGLLKHANALMAFCAPSTNSYKRLVPGYEAPVNLVYPFGTGLRQCGSRCTSENPKTKRIEFRPPDPMCNPYLSFSALLMAGLDGIKKKMDPGKPFEGNTYELDGKAARSSRPSRARSSRRSMHSKQTTSSCSKGVSSPRMSSMSGSSINAPRSMESGSVPTPGSSTSTSICKKINLFFPGKIQYSPMRIFWFPRHT